MALSLLEEHLAEVVRRELARGCRAGATTEPTAPPAAASAESVSALGTARALLAHAVSVGRWRQEDATEMRALFPQMIAADQDRIRTELGNTINGDALHVEVRGPPF